MGKRKEPTPTSNADSDEDVDEESIADKIRNTKKKKHKKTLFS
jgi:hypothetical protein